MANLDLRKPVQNGEGIKYTILATDVREEIPGVSTVRFEGQTLLALGEGRSSPQYFYPDGRYVATTDVRYDLMNVPPEPVVVKSRRAVSVDCDGIVKTTGRSGTYPNEVEFTTTNGVLTGVEIIKANTNVEDC